MKKRLLYFILLFAITIAAVIYGISKRGRLTLSTDDGFSFSFIGKGDTEVSESTDSFSNLQIQLSQDDIEIEAGKNFGWTYKGPKTSVPTVHVDNDTFVIEASSGEKKASSGGTLTVTIPSDHWELGQISLPTKNGDIAIDPDKRASAESLDISSDNGDITLSDCTGKSIGITTGNGDIDLEDASSDAFDLQTSNGDITLNLADSLDHYTITPSTAMGDITVGEDTLSGNKKISVGDGKKTIKAVTGMGDINIDD